MGPIYRFQPSAIRLYQNGFELMDDFDFGSCWDLPVKVSNPRGLGLQVPADPDFDVLDVIRLLSGCILKYLSWSYARA